MKTAEFEMFECSLPLGHHHKYSIRPSADRRHGPCSSPAPPWPWLHANIRTSHCLICQNLNINCVFVCAAAVGGGLQRAEKLLTLDGIATTTAGLNTIDAELDLCITYLSLNFTLYS